MNKEGNYYPFNTEFILSHILDQLSQLSIINNAFSSFCGDRDTIYLFNLDYECFSLP